MKIQTTRFGEIQLEGEQVIHMPDGMPGFPECQRFVIIQNKENSPFFWYQCLDDPDLAFVITRAQLFMPDYDPDLGDEMERMAWTDDTTQSIEIYVVVNIPKGAPERMTGNFMGPLVVNPSCREAVQAVIPTGDYSHKTPLLPQKEDVSDAREKEVRV